MPELLVRASSSHRAPSHKVKQLPLMGGGIDTAGEQAFCMEWVQVRSNKDGLASGVFQGTTRVAESWQVPGNEAFREPPPYFHPPDGCQAAGFAMFGFQGNSRAGDRVEQGKLKYHRPHSSYQDLSHLHWRKASRITASLWLIPEFCQNWVWQLIVSFAPFLEEKNFGSPFYRSVFCFGRWLWP